MFLKEPQQWNEKGELLVDGVYYTIDDGEPMESAKHARQYIYDVQALQRHFEADPNVLVAGNNGIYWERGNRKALVSPDCYVVFGRDKTLREGYFVWREEGIFPSVIFELTSDTTWQHDLNEKKATYQNVFKAQEYFVFDPNQEVVNPPLQEFRLVNDVYEPIQLENNRLYSSVLHLDLVVAGEQMRFYNPASREFLLSYDEHADRARQEAINAARATERAEREALRANQEAKRAAQEALRAEEEAQRAEREVIRAQAAESELERMKAEMEALRKQLGQSG